MLHVFPGEEQPNISNGEGMQEHVSEGPDRLADSLGKAACSSQGVCLQDPGFKKQSTEIAESRQLHPSRNKQQAEAAREQDSASHVAHLRMPNFRVARVRRLVIMSS